MGEGNISNIESCIGVSSTVGSNFSIDHIAILITTCSVTEEVISFGAQATLDLVPEYGYWEDVNRLAQIGVPALEDACIRLIATQFKADEVLLSGHTEGLPKPKLSLVARHMPREHNHKPADKALAKKLAMALCPGDSKALASYRKRLSAVTKALDVAETHFASKDWASLNPATMPGRCLKTHLKGLLNQPVAKKHGRKAPSTDPDRVECAAKFAAHLGRAAKGLATVKGANVVFPHELVAKVMEHLAAPPTLRKWVAAIGSSYVPSDGYDSYEEGYEYSGGVSGSYVETPNPACLSPEEIDAMEAQWRSIVDPIKASGVLGKWVPMCDFSGSMGGDPMHVSMALGLIIAECNTGVFKDMILTFDSTPTLHRFRSTGLFARVQEVWQLAQGTSTNFQAAYNLLLKTLLDAGVQQGEEPTELVVLTDMGFDAACGVGNGYGYATKTKDHETHFQIARRAFVKQSEALLGDGKGYAAPRIVCWNLRAEYKDFQAQADTEGVLQVSGWSPSMLRVLTTSGLDAFTPAAILRAVLSDPRYDAVRERVTPFFQRRPSLVIGASSSRIDGPDSPV